MISEKDIEFLEQPSTIESLKKCSDEESIIQYMKEQGIEISLEKAKLLRGALNQVDIYNGKLSEDQMANIAGGTVTKKIITGILLGTGAVVLIGASGKFAYDVLQCSQEKGTFSGELKNFFNDMNLCRRSPYEAAVKKTADYLFVARNEE